MPKLNRTTLRALLLANATRSFFPGNARLDLVGAVIFLLCALLSQSIRGSEGPEADPFAGDYVIGNSAELFMVWGQAFGDSAAFQKIYDVEGFGEPNLPDEIVEVTRHVQDAVLPVQGRRGMDAAATDLNSDGYDDVVSVWEGPDQLLHLLIPELVAGALDWTNAITVTLSNAVHSSTCGSWSKARLLPANMDNDPEMELVLAYWAEDGTIQLAVLDTDGTLTPAILASTGDEILDPDLIGCDSARFDIAAGDVDLDGRAEVILVGVERDATTFVRWNLFAAVYDFDPGNDVVSPAWSKKGRAVTTWTDLNNNDYRVHRLGVAAGDFDGDTASEGVLAFQIASSDKATLIYLQPFEVEVPEGPPSEPWILRLDRGLEPDVPGRLRIIQATGNQGWPLSLVTGDLNNNGRDELLVAARTAIAAYAIDAVMVTNETSGQVDRYLLPRQLGQAGYTSDGVEDNHRVLALVDVDAEKQLAGDAEPWRQEVLVVENQVMAMDEDLVPVFNVRVLEVTADESSAQFKLLATLVDEPGGSLSPRPFAVAAADLDHTAVRLGRPTYTRRTEIVHPLVVLNALPTHFDRLADSLCPGGFCDVNGCFPGSKCSGSATFERSLVSTVEFTTELTADWAMSEEIKLGLDFELEGVPIKAGTKFSNKYGERFSRSQRYTTTLSIEDRQTATIDDFIYAVVVDYDIWEYPLQADNRDLGHLIAVVPRVQQRRWFDSKSYGAYTYVPNHEPGNILSYAAIAAPQDNEALASAVRFVVADGRTLTGTGSGSWHLTEEGTEATTSSWSTRETVERPYDEFHGLSFTVNVAGTGSERQATYTEEDVQTVASTVTDRRGIAVEFGNVDLSLGNVRYTVTPYLYWARNGALVLDYSVEPEVAASGADAPTFWDLHYGLRDAAGGRPDLAFILPWRYDPEKGLALEEPALRYRTKDIQFDPPEPIAGQEVRILARIHNWSLKESGDPASVRFFEGDPAEGGTLLANVQGDTSVPVLTDSGILQPRGEGFAEFVWRTDPSPVGASLRIYAVIDEENAIEEIHEDNNVGWTVLNLARPPGPVLAARLEQGHVLLSWEGDDYVLQQSFELDGSWEDANRPVQQIGVLRSVEISADVPARFFRLIVP